MQIENIVMSQEDNKFMMSQVQTQTDQPSESIDYFQTKLSGSTNASPILKSKASLDTNISSTRKMTEPMSRKDFSGWTLKELKGSERESGF